MGIFYPYIPFEKTRLIGVEAAGEGLDSGKHSASLQRGSPGVLHGNRTYILQDDNGQITETHSVSAGLDYPGVGPEHAWLKDIGRAEYVGITDEEALEAFHYLCRTEGIIPALESSHAIAYAMKLAKTMKPEQTILVNLSGRGDKDIGTVADLAGVDFYDRPVHARTAGEGRQGMSRIAATFAALRSARPQGADPLRHRRLSVCRHHARADARHGRGRRRRDRAGRAVFRPHGRRPRDPEGRRKGAGAGHRHDAGAGHGAQSFRAKDGTTPVVLMGYANPVERYDLVHGKDAFIRDAAAGRGGWHAGGGLPAGGMRGVRRQAQGQRPRPDLPARTDQHRRAHAAGRPGGQRLCLLRVAQGRDRRRPPGHRRGRAGAPAHPPRM